MPIRFPRCPGMGGAVLAALLAACIPFASAEAQQPAVMYSLEVDRNVFLEEPAARHGLTAQALAAELSDQTGLRAYLFEPVAAVPTPRLAAMVIAADGEVLSRRWIELHDQFLPPSGDRITLRDDAPGAEDDFVELLAPLGADRLQPLVLTKLDHVGDRRMETAIDAASRVLREARREHPTLELNALAVVAVPRTVQIFDERDAAGGGFVIVISSMAQGGR